MAGTPSESALEAPVALLARTLDERRLEPVLEHALLVEVRLAGARRVSVIQVREVGDGLLAASRAAAGFQRVAHAHRREIRASARHANLVRVAAAPTRPAGQVEIEHLHAQRVVGREVSVAQALDVFAERVHGGLGFPTLVGGIGVAVGGDEGHDGGGIRRRCGEGRGGEKDSQVHGNPPFSWLTLRPSLYSVARAWLVVASRTRRPSDPMTSVRTTAVQRPRWITQALASSAPASPGLVKEAAIADSDHCSSNAALAV